MRNDALVAPRPVVIVGDTDESNPSRLLIEALAPVSFTGKIYPVNPKLVDALIVAKPRG